MKRILGILLAGTALATSTAAAQMNALPPQRHLLVCGEAEGEIVATSMDIEPRERYDARCS